MNRNNMSSRITLFLFYLLLTVTVFLPAHHVMGRSTTDQNNSLQIKDVSFTIIGTSNVRDWEIVSDTMAGIIRFGPAFTSFDSFDEVRESPDQWFDEVSLHIPAQSLDSGIGTMNSTMHEYLKSDEYPKLEYRLNNVKEVQKGSNPDELIFHVDGIASSAGTDHHMAHEVVIHRETTDIFRISGELEMKISDFDIDPPTFMRGLLVTEDAITVDYNFSVVRNNNE